MKCAEELDRRSFAIRISNVPAREADDPRAQPWHSNGVLKGEITILTYALIGLEECLKNDRVVFKEV